MSFRHFSSFFISFQLALIVLIIPISSMTSYVESEEGEASPLVYDDASSRDDHFLINRYPQDGNHPEQFEAEHLTDEEIDSEAQFLAKLHKYAAENGHLYSDDQSVDMSHHFFDRVRRRKQRICGEMILKILNQRCGGCFRPADSKVKVDRKRDLTASKRPTITEICCHQANCTDEILQEFCCGGQS